MPLFLALPRMEVKREHQLVMTVSILARVARHSRLARVAETRVAAACLSFASVKLTMVLRLPPMMWSGDQVKAQYLRSGQREREGTVSRRNGSGRVDVEARGGSGAA